MASETRLIIADDHQLLRDGLRLTLEAATGYHIVAEASNTAMLEQQVKEHQPDIVVSDYNMPSGNMLEVLARLKDDKPDLKFIILTGVVSGTLYKQLLDIPVDGVLLKEGSMDDILNGLTKVSQGQTVLSDIVREQIDRVDEILTSRELEIMNLVVKGASNSDISSTLFISPKTVDNHRSNIFKKLGVRSAVELAEYARKNGLLSDG
ncbi:response regulator transcription factor [Oceanicoccus sagamiensis]|nr:response regulator transcription factor [Oceanicoccus sagamiensis]